VLERFPAQLISIKKFPFVAIEKILFSLVPFLLADAKF
jgi:hypothetical protein